MNPTNGPKVEIKTTVDTQGSLKQIHDTVAAISRSVQLTGGAIASYEKRVNTLIKGLEQITRQGSNAGQTVRDLSLAGGGSSIAGRVRQSNARNTKADMAQVQEVLVADIVNFQAGVYKSVARSVKSALITSLAKSKQDLASVDAEIRAAQIEAQRARVGFATQLSGTRGNVRGTITQNANALGVQNLGTLKAEQAALDKLLAQEQAYKAQAKLVNTELRQQEQLMGSIQRLSNTRLQPMRQQIEALQKQNAIERANLEIYKAQQRGDPSGVLRARMKQESLRLDQMSLRGVKEESAEWQKQIALIKQINGEQQRLNEQRRSGTKELRDQARLQESRNFAAGRGSNQEVMQNNIIGSRRIAMTTESRASLLGMQGNLLMNYGLLGGGVAAIGGMTAAVVELDAKLRELQAIAGATNAEFEGLREVIIKTSEDTKFSAVELAEASVMLAQVGQSVSEIEESLPIISSFAMAVGTDMKNAVDIVTTSLTVFNMNAEQTQRITNVLTEALNRSKLSMDQLVLGFQYAANIAADSGVTFEELTAVLAGMSQAGIRSGSMLGTGLRQILISLAAPTEEITTMLATLGLTLNDVDVKAHGLTGVLENLAEAGITAGDAMGAFETRTAAALVAATNQVDFIRGVQEQFAFTRAAEEAAAKQSESFKNSLLELKNEFLSFINDAARPVLNLLIDVVKTLKAVGNAIGPVVPLIKAMGTAIIMFAGATAVAGITKLGIEFVKFSGILSGFGTLLPRLSMAWNMFALSMTTAGTASQRAALGFAALNASFPPLLLLAGVAAGITAIYMAMRDSTTESDKFSEAMDRQQTAFNEAKAAQDKYQQVLSQLDQTIARVKARSDNMKDGSEELRIEILNGAAAFNEYGAGIDATNIKMQAYIESLNNAKSAVIALAQEQAKEAAQQASSEERNATGSFRQSWDMLRGSVFTNTGMAGRAFADAVRSDKLSEQEIANMRNAWRVLEALTKQEAQDLDAGEISNAMTNLQVLLNAFAKAEVDTELMGRMDRVRSRGAILMSARSQNQQAQVSAGGLALLSNPDWVNFRQRVTGMVGPLGNLTGDLSDVARANRQNPAEAFRQQERILSQYGARFRQITADLEKMKTDYDYNNRTAEQRYAFDQTMNPINDELVRIREVLLNTQRQNDQLAAENLQVLRPLVEAAPSSEFNELMTRARSLGLAPTANNKNELLDWIDRELSRRQNGVNVDTLLGRNAGMSVIRQSIREEQIRQTGAVASAERIPMAQRIRDAATAFGLSPDLMRTIASIETGGTFNPRAQNPRSSAGGLFQFTDATWNRLGGGDKYNAELNMTRAMEEMTRRLEKMTENLGRRPEDYEMYMAWQQGTAGASALIKNPNANAIETLTPLYQREYGRERGAQVARQAVLLNGGTAEMTGAEFAQVWRQKFAQHRSGASNDSMRSLGESAESAAEEARRSLEQVAEGARSIATTAKGLATRTLRNLGPETSDENAMAAVESITVSLQEVEDQTARYYRLRLEALINFRDQMDAAGRLTPQQYAELNVQIADLQEAQTNEMDRVQEDTINTLTDLYEKLPQFAGSIGQMADRIGEALDGLTNVFEASAENIEVRLQEARERIASDIDARAVAAGRMTNAEANARAALRARDARRAADAALPGTLANAIGRQGIITQGLDTQLGNTGMTLRQVDMARLTAEREKLQRMNREDEAAYAAQNALVNELAENLGKANEYRMQERDLLIEIEALTESINSTELGFGERVQTILEGWAEERGTSKSMVDGYLEGIPDILNTTESAFAQFFSDVASGTASVGDAFKAMAQTILKAMMDVVASEAAKQFMKLILQMGQSFFGAPSGPNPGGPPADLNGLYREGGIIRAAGGYGPVRGRDSVNIKAMPGEFVMRKSAVDAIGADNLSYLNAQGNRINSGALAAKPVIVAPTVNQERPLEVYIVSPENQPPPTKDQIIVMVQEDMINRGPVYKTTKAIQQGAI